MNPAWIASLKRPLPSAERLSFAMRGCRQMMHGIEMGRIEVPTDMIYILRMHDGPEKLAGLFTIYDAWRDNFRRSYKTT